MIKLSDQEFLDSITPLEKGIADLHMQALELYEDPKYVLEIGSGWGIFARIYLMKYPKMILTTIDKQKNLFEFDRNVAGYEDRIIRIHGESKEALTAFSPDTFDVIFIDGDHGYKGFKEDFITSWELIKDRGVIYVDDVFHKKNWENDYGIMKALAELSLEKKFSVQIFPVAHGIAHILVQKS